MCTGCNASNAHPGRRELSGLRKLLERASAIYHPDTDNKEDYILAPNTDNEENFYETKPLHRKISEKLLSCIPASPLRASTLFDSTRSAERLPPIGFENIFNSTISLHGLPPLAFKEFLEDTLAECMEMSQEAMSRDSMVATLTNILRWQSLDSGIGAEEEGEKLQMLLRREGNGKINQAEMLELSKLREEMIRQENLTSMANGYGEEEGEADGEDLSIQESGEDIVGRDPRSEAPSSK